VVKTFGDFEFDDRRRGLTAGGRPVRLSGQAVDLLCLLVERPGELITREEIARRLWPDTTVDFDHSLEVVLLIHLRAAAAVRNGALSTQGMSTCGVGRYAFSSVCVV
jgi:DNA-binding winged helix-turn-helix (wHTH) protein